VIGHILLSLGLSGAAIAILVAGLRFRPKTPLWGFSLIFFLAIWAGGLWVARVGPPHLGVVWLPFLMIAILLAVLVVVLAPRGGRRRAASRRSSARSRWDSACSSGC
jgi:hypothetical protein